MMESSLPGCVWRGDEGDGSSFHCFHESVRKTVCPSDCETCTFRLEPHLTYEEPDRVVEVITEKPPAVEEPEYEKPSLIGKISNGIAGLTKAAIGMDYPGDDVVKQRWDICKTCEHFRLWQCGICGCLVSAKIRLSGESCPVQKWKAVE